MRSIFKYFERWSKPALFSLGLSLIIIMGIIDYATGPDFSVFAFYLVPVFLGTWFVGRWAGIMFSVLSAIAWSLADMMLSRVFSNAVIPYWNLTMQVGFFLLIAYVLSILKTSLEHEKEMARTDHLTGAVNSRYFTELAALEISRMRRYGRSFTAVYMDLDNFKTVNDTLGHDIGDTLLQTVVKTVMNHTRANDVIVRLGGDEFLIFLPETGPDVAQTAIKKIRRFLLDVMEWNSWPVTFSFGMITFTCPPLSVDHLIKLTDQVMYRAKKEGKNRIVHRVFSSDGNNDCVRDYEFRG